MAETIKIMEELGWKVTEGLQNGDSYYEMQIHSDAGENFFITLWGNTPEEVAKNACDRYHIFDPDEHVKQVMNWEGAPSISVLLHDAEKIKEMLEELSLSLSRGEVTHINRDNGKDRLWNILLEHFGHKVEIAVYGDPENPASVTLEDLDTNSVILDADLYTLTARDLA